MEFLDISTRSELFFYFFLVSKKNNHYLCITNLKGIHNKDYSVVNIKESQNYFLIVAVLFFNNIWRCFTGKLTMSEE